jgi:hypothetical protein
MRSRLSALMFLQYAAPGALLPLFSLRLSELGFSPREIGLACATQSLACVLAPGVIGQVADRWFASERCLSACALVSAVLFWVLADLTQPWAVFLVSLCLWLVLVPSLTLGVALCFAHLPQPDRQFGPVRLWGTVGWVASGLALGGWFSNPSWLAGVLGALRPSRPTSELADAFRLGGLLAAGLAGYALTLPHTPPARSAAARLAPLAALRLLRQRAFAVYFACNLGVALTIAFTTQLTPLLLQHLGIRKEWIPPTLTISQSMEIIALALLALFAIGFVEATRQAPPPTPVDPASPITAEDPAIATNLVESTDGRVRTGHS